MELTRDELEFLRNYRRLSEHDKGYVDAMLESLDRRQGWSVCKKEVDDVGKTSYQTLKENARQYGIRTQQWISKHNLSYGELAAIQDDLYAVARKYGLVREFKENGIL